MTIDYVGFLRALLSNIFSLPVKGVAYAELEFVFMHLYFGYKALMAGLNLVAPIIIMVIGIIIMIGSAIGHRPHVGPHARKGISRVAHGIGHFLWRISTALVRSWIYMLYGACVTDDSDHEIKLDYGHNVTRVSINYMIGRTFYRAFRRLFGTIPFIRNHAWLHSGLAHLFATALAAVLLFWRIWFFATDLGF